MHQQRDDLAVSTSRIGDLERQECLALLSQHHLQGRLRDGEHDERVGQALQARTEADLLVLLTDLPGSGGRASRRGRRSALLDVCRSWWERVGVPVTGVSAAAYFLSVVVAGGRPTTDDALAASLITGAVGYVVGRRRR